MVEPKLARAYGTLAGYGFIGVALLALPSTRLLEPQPEAQAYLLTLLGLVTGLACLAVPWGGLDPRWLHLLGVVATAETAATVAVFGMPYVAFYFLIAVLVAYVAPDPRTVALHLGFILLALFGPVLYGPEDARASLSVALVAAPPLILTAGLFSYLRMKMVHDRRAYHRFAEQTLVLSSRIAGRQIGPLGLVPQPEPVARLSRVRPPRAWLAAAAAVLGVPLFAGGLAVAGVQLPGVATDPFERIGIELPNQDTDTTAAPGPRTGRAKAQVARDDGARSKKARDGEGDAKRGAGKTAATTGPARSEGEAPPGSVGAASPVPQAPLPAPPANAPAVPTAPGGGEQSKSPLDDLLKDATDGLQGILDGLKAGGK